MDGTCGNNVFNVDNFDNIDNILDKLFAHNFSISMCPFYDIKNEHRVVMLNGKCELAYTKFLPKVIGNGTDSIRQLLFDFNYEFFKNRLHDSKYDEILGNGETFEYNWKYNLSKGAIAKKIENLNLKNELIKIAKLVCDTINLKFGSIDIIETIDNNFFVMEVNSGVMIENYVKQHPSEYTNIKQIYKKAIYELFCI